MHIVNYGAKAQEDAVFHRAMNLKSQEWSQQQTCLACLCLLLAGGVINISVMSWNATDSTPESEEGTNNKQGGALLIKERCCYFISLLSDICE